MTVVSLESEEVAEAGRCQSVAECFRPHARRLIGRAAREVLDEMKMIPTEVMASASMIKRMHDQGQNLQRVVQIISGAQARVYNTDLHKRMRVVFQIADKMMEVVEDLDKKVGEPAIKPGALGATIQVVTAAVGKDSAEMGTLIALTKYLSRANDWDNKLALLLDLLEPETDPDAIEDLDSLIGEALDSVVGLKALFGNAENLGDRLLELIHLHKGMWPPLHVEQERTVPKRLNSCLRRHAMPLTRLTIRTQILRNLTAGVPLSRQAGAGELIRLCEIHEALDLPDGSKLCGQPAVDALEKRMNRQVEPENLMTLLEDKKLLEKLQSLFLLQRRVIGANGKKQIGEVIRMQFEKRSFSEEMLASGESMSAKLKAISTLFDDVMMSELAPSLKEKLGEQLETIQMKYIKDNKIFSKISQQCRNVAEAVLRLLDLCRNGMFTKGQNLVYVHSLIKHQLAQADFKKAYLAGAVTEEERQKRMKDLKRRMLEAGLEDAPRPGQGQGTGRPVHAA